VWLQNDSPLNVCRHVTMCSALNMVRSVVEDLISQPSIRQTSLASAFLLGIREEIGLFKARRESNSQSESFMLLHSGQSRELVGNELYFKWRIVR
jgi:hypothetical protein